MTSPEARARRVELILERLERLPTLAPVAVRLMHIGSADEADLGEVIALLESDPSLSAAVLAACRRADLGLGDRIATVRRAIVMLGLEAVQSIVLSVGVYGLLGQGGGDADAAFDHEGLWTHCVSVGVGAELIAGAHRSLGVQPDLAFAAGLLADLGRLALEHALPGGYAGVIKAAEARRCDSAPVERELLGLDHFVAGRRLAERWGLPEPIRDVIWLHAQPLASVPEVEHRRLVGVVTLAKAWARSSHLGWSADFGQSPDIADLCADLGLGAAALEPLGQRLAAGVARRCEMLGIGTPTAPGLLLEAVARANGRLSALNTRLSRRARQADAQRAALSSLSTFCATADPARGMADTLGAVVRSACPVLGAGFYGAVHQRGQAWEVLQFSPGGEVRRRDAAEAPPGGARSLAALGAPGVPMAAMAVLPWLSDYLADAADLRNVRVLALTDGAEAPAAVLLHEADPAAAGLDGACLAALVAAWGSAVRAAALHERSSLLGERLAEANRRVHEMQRALTERESLARLGEMTAGAAHEMNNPLTVIRGRAQLLATRLGDARDRASASAIAEAADDLTGLISALHLVASPPEPKVALYDPVLVVRSAVAAAKAAARVEGGATRVQVETSGEPSSVRADADLAARAIAALVTNAMEAAPGKIVRVGVQTGPAEGRWVVSVADQGPGLSDRAMRHAFDPFFSEKPAGRQRGLGLPAARTLAERLGGRITLTNAAAGGAVATIEFLPPAASARAA